MQTAPGPFKILRSKAPKPHISPRKSPPSKIVNLASIHLSEVNKQVLAKGLKFIPHTFIPSSKLRQDESQVARRKIILPIAALEVSPSSPSTLPLHSEWSPSTSYIKLVDQYADKIEKLIQDPPISIPHRTKAINFSKPESVALKNLSQNHKITIKKSDKSSSLVVMDTTDYVKSAMLQLNNREFYRPLQQPKYPDNARVLEQILYQMFHKQHLSEKELFFLLPPPVPRPRLFYGLPKVHKPRTKWSHGIPPLRPIISDCGSESYNISKLIDPQLQLVSQNHFSYIKDTWHFLQLISAHKPTPQAILASADVESLYTNIPLDELLHRTQVALDKRPIQRPETSDLIKLLHIQLFNNDFMFQDKTFLQVHGISMGKAFSPSLANIYMAEYDAILIKETTKLGIPPPSLYLRYLDDIFIIYDHGLPNFQKFMQVANIIDPHIKLTFESHQSHMNFLDVTVFKNYDFHLSLHLDSKTFWKETQMHQYLLSSSAHQSNVRKSLIKGMFIRLRRICSRFSDFISLSNQMVTFFFQQRIFPSIYPQIPARSHS